MLAAIVEDGVFCSEDKPLKVIAVSDQEQDVDVYIDGNYYKTVHVYTSPTEITIWDTVPVSEGLHEVKLEGRESSVKFKIVYSKNCITVYTEKEDGTPLQTICHAVNLLTFVSRTSNLYAEAFGFPVDNWKPENVLVEFIKHEEDGTYYWIGTLKDLIDMAENSTVHLKLKKRKVWYVEIIYDKEALLDWLRNTARVAFPETYLLTDEQLDEIHSYNPLLMASHASHILGLRMPVVDAWFTDTELHVVYRVEGGVPTVVLAVIFVLALAASIYIASVGISSIIKEVKTVVMPQVNMVEKMTEYEKKRLELIEKIIEKYPPEQAQKMVEYVNSTTPSLATQIAEVSKAPTTTAIPIGLIVIIVLVLLLLFSSKRS